MAYCYKEIRSTVDGVIMAGLFLSQKSVKLRNRSGKKMAVCTYVLNEDHMYHTLEVIYYDSKDRELFKYEYVAETARTSHIGCANLELVESVEIVCDGMITPGKGIQISFVYKEVA